MVEPTNCEYCGAPCREEVLPRGGEYGWGDDKSRTVRRYIASPPSPALEEALDAYVRLVATRDARCRDDGFGEELDIARARVFDQAGREGWRPIHTAPKDGTPVLLRFKDSLAKYGERLEHWAGLQFVGRHPGVRSSGFDMGWGFAAPVGMGGFDDAWLAGWMPLPARSSPSLRTKEVKDEQPAV